MKEVTMKGKIVSILAIIAVLLACLFTGCGVSQEEHDRVITQFRAPQVEYDRVDAELRAPQAQIAEQQGQTEELEEQNELVGETPTDTAINIIKHYHQTHFYSEYYFYVCSDMTLDVWNMLKAQGIDALIQLGNVETRVRDITESDHTWVLAEVSPGHYLALETTGGYAVQKKDNPLYYQGWAFDNPREYKRFMELKQEYDIRVQIIEQLTNKTAESYKEYEMGYGYYQELVDEFNRRYTGRRVSSDSQMYEDEIEAQLATIKEREGKYSQLNELINDQLQDLENIAAEMRGLSG